MTASQDSTSESRYEDSRLREFLRRAAPILAAERGWNERSQLKIKSLATELRLPESLYEKGVHKLREGKLRYEERFTVYERAFLKKLESDFRKSKTSVFTAAQESHVIQIAVTEYQISEARAREIIREAAEQLGIKRVSKRDAAEYLTRLVKEQSDEQGQLSENSRQRIQQAAAKWGCDEHELEAILNDFQQAPRSASNPLRMFGIGIVATSSLLGILAGLYYLFSPEGTPNASSSSVETESKKVANTPPVASAFPTWWSLVTTEYVEDFLSDHRTERFPRSSLKSSDLGDRLQAYQEILDLSNSSGADFSVDCRLLFASLFRDETMDASRQMVDMIVQTATLPSNQLPANARSFSRGWQAFELLKKCYEESTDAPKKKLLESASHQFMGTNPTLNNSGLLSKQTYSDQQWRYLKTASSKNPALAASLVEALSDLTREHLPEGNDLEFSTSINLLPLAPSSWKQMPKTLSRIIDSADEDQLRFLHLIQEQIGETEFQTWLGLRMAKKLNLPTQGATAKKITEAIAKRLNLPLNGNQIKSQQSKPRIGIRGLEDFLKAELKADPQTIATASHYATVALLMSEGEKRAEPHLLTKANELIKNGVPVLKPGKASTQRSLPIYRSIDRRALPSDIRSQEVALRKLENAADNSDPVNANAFERLTRSASRFRDIDWADALTVARFILEATGDSERVEIEKNLGKLRHWPNLGLALATQIQDSDGDLDQAMTCISLLLDFQPSISDSDWRRELSNQIRERVALGLKFTAESGGFDSRFEWDALRDVLIDQYRIRCTLFGIPGSTVNSINSPVELANLLTKATATSSNSSVDQEIQSNRFLSENEMQLFALQAALAAQSLKTEPVNPGNGQAATPGAAILENELRILRSRTGVEP